MKKILSLKLWLVILVIGLASVFYFNTLGVEKTPVMMYKSYPRSTLPPPAPNGHDIDVMEIMKLAGNCLTGLGGIGAGIAAVSKLFKRREN